MAAGRPVDITALVAGLVSRFDGLNPDKLERHLAEIVDWNEQLGLVSKRSAGEVLERMVRQSVQLLYFVEDNVIFDQPAGGIRVVDIGSGGGFPGIIWKIIRPGIALVLVERKGKKAAFLERTAIRLGMGDIEVVQKDAIEACRSKRYAGNFDLATATAVAPTAVLAPAIEGFLRPGGYYCTVRPREELEQYQKSGSRLELQHTARKDDSDYNLYRMVK